MIHITKDSENVNDISETDGNISINIPNKTVSRSNNLSQISGASSKYTLSGDDILSNISFESSNISNSKLSNDIDNEIVIKNKISKDVHENEDSLIKKQSYENKRFIIYN